MKATLVYLLIVFLFLLITFGSFYCIHSSLIGYKKEKKIKVSLPIESILPIKNRSGFNFFEIKINSLNSFICNPREYYLEEKIMRDSSLVGAIANLVMPESYYLILTNSQKYVEQSFFETLIKGERFFGVSSLSVGNVNLINQKPLFWYSIVYFFFGVLGLLISCLLFYLVKRPSVIFNVIKKA